MNATPDQFNRVKLLTGHDTFDRIRQARIIIFGVGGVGSWTAECLIRSGIHHLTIVDADRVAASNINRQLMATTLTVGQPKVKLLKDRLLQISPQACITAIEERYDSSTAPKYDLTAYDYIIDAIDSLADKALLILNATASRRRFYSSMGAALKADPTRIKVDEFWKVKGCPLAAALRNRFKRSGVMPRRKFKCVYSDELLPNRCTDEDVSGAMTFNKVRTNGALCHITAIFGMTLGGLVIEDLMSADRNKDKN